MAGGIAAATWSLDATDRIDLFWRDDVFAMSHIDGDGSKWTSNRIGPLKPVTPESPDALGGIFTTVPAAAWTLAQPPLAPPTSPPPVHHEPVATPTPDGRIRPRRPKRRPLQIPPGATTYPAGRS